MTKESSVSIISDLSASSLTSLTHRTAFFEPTSDIKALRILESMSSDTPPISHMAPNIHELKALYQCLRDSERLIFDAEHMDRFSTNEQFRNDLRKNLPTWVTEEGIVQMAVQLLPVSETLWVKAESRGLIVVQSIEKDKGQSAAWRRTASSRSNQTVACSGAAHDLVVRYYPALPIADTASVVGGGDSMLGAILAGVVKGNLRSWVPSELDTLAEIGQR